MHRLCAPPKCMHARQWGFHRVSKKVGSPVCQGWSVNGILKHGMQRLQGPGEGEGGNMLQGLLCAFAV